MNIGLTVFLTAFGLFAIWGIWKTIKEEKLEDYAKWYRDTHEV